MNKGQGGKLEKTIGKEGEEEKEAKKNKKWQEKKQSQKRRRKGRKGKKNMFVHNQNPPPPTTTVLRSHNKDYERKVERLIEGRERREREGARRGQEEKKNNAVELLPIT